MATPEFARVAAARRLGAARVGREALAAAGLVGIVVASSMFVAATASGPFRFVRDGAVVRASLPWSSSPSCFSRSTCWWWSSRTPCGRAGRSPRSLVHLLFLLGPPQWLSDAFNYLGFARLGALHGINPYAHTPGCCAA